MQFSCLYCTSKKKPHQLSVQRNQWLHARLLQRPTDAGQNVCRRPQFYLREGTLAVMAVKPPWLRMSSREYFCQGLYSKQCRMVESLSKIWPQSVRIRMIINGKQVPKPRLALQLMPHNYPSMQCKLQTGFTHYFTTTCLEELSGQWPSGQLAEVV